MKIFWVFFLILSFSFGNFVKYSPLVEIGDNKNGFGPLLDNSYFGISVACADFNDDQRLELIVGAYGDDTNGFLIF